MGHRSPAFFDNLMQCVDLIIKVTVSHCTFNNSVRCFPHIFSAFQSWHVFHQFLFSQDFNNFNTFRRCSIAQFNQIRFKKLINPTFILKNIANYWLILEQVWKSPRFLPKTRTFSDQQKCSRNTLIFVANKHLRLFFFFYVSYTFMIFDL